MSAHEPIPLARAMELANHCVDKLRPVCEHIAVAGSIRRDRWMVCDIEIVAAPIVTRDLLGEEQHDSESIRQVVSTLGALAKRGDKFVQATDVLGVPGLSIDVFVVTPPANWFCILAIRTGPAGLSRAAVTRMKAWGFACVDGRILDPHGKPVPITSEADFFRCAGLPCLPPEHRDTLAGELLRPDGRATDRGRSA